MATLENLHKPFLTVDTGEAYQPIRLNYEVFDTDQLIDSLNQLKCCQKNPTINSWNWYWKDECNDLHFESLDSYRKNIEHPTRLGTIIIRDKILYLNLPSFKRACLAVPFFHRLLADKIRAHHADFINKVFGLEDRLPHGFADIFKEEELESMIQQRLVEYQQIQEQCENADNMEEAFSILSTYTKAEAQKKLPYAERYVFHYDETDDPDIIFLGFYIFLRGRELVAIRRWFGNMNYSLASAAEETIEQVFGGMNIDIIE